MITPINFDAIIDLMWTSVANATEKLRYWLTDDFGSKEATVINYAKHHLCIFNWKPSLIYWWSALQRNSKTLYPNYKWLPALWAATYSANNIPRARQFIYLCFNLLLDVSSCRHCQINKNVLWMRFLFSFKS